MSKSKPVTKTSTQNSTTTTSIPSWLTNAAQGVAGEVSGLPTYQPYSGQFAAPLSGNQNTAIDYVKGLLGNASGIAMGGVPGATAATGFNAPAITAGGVGADTQSLLSPYTHNVIDATNNEIDRSKVLQQQQNDNQAAVNHVFNGDRAGVVQSMNDRDFNTIKANTDASLLNNGYNTAEAAALGINQNNQNAAINSAGINVAGANALTGLTGAVSGANTADVNGLLTTGNTAQQTQQTQDTAQYQDYLNSYNALLQHLQLQGGVLGSLPHDSTSTGTSTGSETSQVYSNALGPVLGLGLGLASLGTGGGATLGGSLVSGLLSKAA